MKKLLFVFLLISFQSLAQTKGDNTLAITSTTADLFQEVGKYLIQDGYQIADSNSDFQTVTTEWKEIKWIKYRLILAVVGNEIHVQSKASNGLSEWQVDFKKSGVENDIWTRMEVFGSHFGTEKKYVAK